jgi:fido (protein-threonine AMPylation protein)
VPGRYREPRQQGKSTQIAYEVAKISWSRGLAQCEESEDIMAEIHKHMFQPVYSHYA